ncbi:DsbA family protein [Nocardia sp. 004]|uniref:DsbA family protein n=1 Tax=Nocardia sp. 004 TaxID=3385978 RepID=UPI00399FC55E
MSNYPSYQQPSPHQAPNRRLFVILTPFLVLLVVAAAAGIGLLARPAVADKIPGVATVANNSSIPANVSADGSVLVGSPDAQVTVRVVMDLQCPACKAFEQANGEVLEESVDNDTAAVEYSVITFLDRMSTTEYSSRAGNASFCVANSGVDNYQTWLSDMFTLQPSEGGSGLPDSALIDIAESAGYTDPAVAECITERRYDAYLRTKTDEVLNSGVHSTPTVTVNGERVTDTAALMGRNGLAAVIAAAR